MEVKINREIREYTESLFFGLSLRQCLFSFCALGVAVSLYFMLRNHFGLETVSWVCVLGATPFAALGFVKYNGMNAEQFIIAWVKSEFLIPKRLVFKSTNMYYELIKNGEWRMNNDSVCSADNLKSSPQAILPLSIINSSLSIKNGGLADD